MNLKRLNDIKKKINGDVKSLTPIEANEICRYLLEIIDSSSNVDTREDALMQMLEIYYLKAKRELTRSAKYRGFLRKIAGADYHKGYELDYFLYVSHWIRANQESGIFDDDLWKMLKKYNPRKSKFLRPGQICYART